MASQTQRSELKTDIPGTVIFSVMTAPKVHQAARVFKDLGEYTFERTITITEVPNSDGDFLVRVVDVKRAIGVKCRLGTGSGGAADYSRSFSKVWRTSV